ncbi:hypothetical protein LTR97_006743 [Elasticomyces elasticus]|uniref:Uncharacterized protein n=1 Tax=Elasticomyces elasticus TaxID=574655 RepID=A0AAN7W3D4_9PEZI|nr:hypothetical protein LTR97_006743 [Elasticomyces elasticus]
MRSTLFLAPLLAAIGGTKAQHGHVEIPEVEEYLDPLPWAIADVLAPPIPKTHQASAAKAYRSV